MKIKNAVKIGAITGGLLLGGYHLSPKTGYLTHEVQKELFDTLGKKEILKDQETNDAIKLISGTITQKEFTDLLGRHGCQKNIDISTIIDPDQALYLSILELQTKYANPCITFSGDSIDNFLLRGDKRAYFKSSKNTMYLHNMDSSPLDFQNLKNKEKLTQKLITSGNIFAVDTRQRDLLNARVAELSHAKQLKEFGETKMQMKWISSFVKSGFDYEKSYKVPGTLEYQAHEEYEKKIVSEFIQLYEKYSDPTDQQKLFTLAKFCGGFFESYQNIEKMLQCLETLDKLNNENAVSLLGNYYTKICMEHFYDPMNGKLMLDAQPKMINNRLYTATELFTNIMKYQKKSYELGNVDAGLALIDFLYNTTWMNYGDVIISLGEDIVQHHSQEVEKSDLSMLYSKLASVYSFFKHDESKCQFYTNLSVLCN